MSRRLSQAGLDALPAAVARPRYDRAAVRTGIVHLGLGAFHRAHQAAYTEAVLAAGDARWGTVAASLRSADTRDALAPQDGLYTLDVRGEESTYAVLGGLRRVLVAPESPAALLDEMCRPEVAVVSLTVTEKAYCRDPATGQLDEAHPDIRHDLAHPHMPRSAPGFLAAGIARRRQAGLPPFTVLCCDNLPANGEAVHRVLVRFAGLLSPGLGGPDLDAYVRDEVACPNTMVDRIVPATTDEDRARVAAALGVEDAWPVVAEPFTQWVIEDRFPAGRPAWEMAGAQFVADVAPFEAMKLRLLNGAHSALAYLGQLAGHETVADAMDDPGLAAYVPGLMADAAATLTMPPGTDVAGYALSLQRRFRNPALRHRTGQIAMRRLAEAAPAPAGRGAGAADPGLAHRAPRAGGRGLDALRGRVGRAGSPPRRARPARRGACGHRARGRPGAGAVGLCLVGRRRGVRRRLVGRPARPRAGDGGADPALCARRQPGGDDGGVMARAAGRRPNSRPEIPGAAEPEIRLARRRVPTGFL